jgi:hypothetical protein
MGYLLGPMKSRMFFSFFILFNHDTHFMPIPRRQRKGGSILQRFHSSYERGCQGKKILPAPQEDAGVVTCIQPHLIPYLILRGVIGLVALDRRAFQRRCQPQLLVPTQRFHDVVVLDAIRLRSYAS